MIKFGYTIQYVEDVEKTISFFENAFGLKRRFVTEENDYGELETGETTLAFASNDLGGSNFPGGFVASSNSEKPLGVEVALVTEEVQKFHANALAEGAVEISAPSQKPWGQVVSYVHSPSGVLIELCTPVSGSGA